MGLNLPSRINEMETRKIKLDGKDKRILNLVFDHGRRPLHEIAKHVSLSKDTVRYRLQKMREKWFIHKYYAEINFSKLGYFEYLLALVVNKQDEQKVQSLITQLSKHPHVKRVLEFSEKWDLEILIIARSITEFDQISNDITKGFEEIIMEKDRIATIKVFQSYLMPDIFLEDRAPYLLPREQTTIRLDNLDYSILAVLSEKGRYSTYKIAQILKISHDTVNNRIKKMCSEGVIDAFHIEMNFSMLNYHWYSVPFDVMSFGEKEELAVQEIVRKNRNILSAKKTLGQYNFRINVLAPSVMELYKIIQDIKNTFMGRIKSHQIWIVIKEHYHSTLPHALLENAQVNFPEIP